MADDAPVFDPGQARPLNQGTGVPPPFDQTTARPVQAAPPPAPDVPMDGPRPTQAGDTRSTGERLATGFMDPFYGMAQIGARLHQAEAMSSPFADYGSDFSKKNIETVDGLVRDREAEIARKRGKDRGIDWWRVGGTALNPAVYGGAFVGGLPGAALSGMMASMAMPTTETKDFPKHLAKEAMLGSIFGVAGGTLPQIAGRAVSPLLGHVANGLLAAGVELTPGQLARGLMQRAQTSARSLPLLGNFIRRGEELAASVPGLGIPIADAHRRSIDSFNRATTDQVLNVVGQRLPAAAIIGNDSIEHTRMALGQVYDDLLPRLSFTIDGDFTRDMADIAARVTELNPAHRDMYNNILRNRLTSHLGGGSPRGPDLTGERFKRIDTELRELAERHRRSGDGGERELGERLTEVREALMEGALRQNPRYREPLQNLQTAYAMFKRIQRAAVSAGRTQGVYSPGQLLDAIKVLDTSKDKARFSEGNAIMQEFANWGQFLLPNEVPNSGTADRAMWAILLGLGGHELGVTLKQAAVGGAMALPYTRPGGALVRGIATPGPARQQLRQRVIEETPRAGAAAGAAEAQPDQRMKFDAQGNREKHSALEPGATRKRDLVSPGKPGPPDEYEIEEPARVGPVYSENTITPSDVRRIERAIDRGDDNTVLRYRRLMQQRGIDPDTIPILQIGRTS